MVSDNIDLTIKQISQLFLKEIYADHQIHNGNSYTNMTDVAKKLGLKEHDARIIQATTILDDLGYLECMKMRSGVSLVKLTASGLSYIEESNDLSGKDFKNPTTKTTMNFMGNVYNSQFNNNSVNSTQTNTVNESSVFEKLIKVLNDSNDISKTDKQDLLADIAVIKHEISRSNPDVSYLQSKVNFIKKFTPLLPYVPALLEMIKKL